MFGVLRWTVGDLVGYGGVMLVVGGCCVKMKKWKTQKTKCPLQVMIKDKIKQQAGEPGVLTCVFGN